MQLRSRSGKTAAGVNAGLAANAANLESGLHSEVAVHTAFAVMSRTSKILSHQQDWKRALLMDKAGRAARKKRNNTPAKGQTGLEPVT